MTCIWLNYDKENKLIEITVEKRRFLSRYFWENKFEEEKILPILRVTYDIYRQNNSERKHLYVPR